MLCYYNRGSCTHTNNRGNEWWQVDLGRVYQIDHVRVWGRTDAHTERLAGARVSISLKSIVGDYFTLKLPIFHLLFHLLFAIRLYI